MPGMDTEQLKTFVEVVRLGSFAAVAREFATDPSAVTRSIAALEKSLGVRLLERTTRRLALTKAGAAYHESVRGLLKDLQRATDEARDLAGQPEGVVRVTASVSYGYSVLVPMLTALGKAYPKLEIDLRLTDSIVDLVAERVDVALRLRQAADSSLVGVRLARIRYHVCASPAYLKQHETPLTPAELAGHDCLRCPVPGYSAQWRFRDTFGGIDGIDIHGRLTMSNSLALQRAAQQGLGPALLPDWLVSADLTAGRLIDLFPSYEATPTDFDNAIWLLHTSRSYIPHRVRAFLDFVKGRYAEKSRTKAA
jgi:DNA-binding transcriptional LysR family regulator